MNFYALNETAINDWATQFGSGASSMALTAQGQAHAEIHQYGQAALVYGAAGGGVLARVGSGAAAAVLAVSGIGFLRMFCAGHAAQSLMAAGSGVTSQMLTGAADMRMAADGVGTASLPNHAVAALAMYVQDLSANPIAVRGSCDLNMAMSAAYGIPTNHARSGVVVNRRDRVLLVHADRRGVEVERDTKMRTSKQDRLRVSRERWG